MSNKIGEGVKKVIGNHTFEYGWTKYTTTNGNRQREWNKIDGKRVSQKLFWETMRQAKQAAAAQ